MRVTTGQGGFIVKTIKQLADELGVTKQTIRNNKPDDIEWIVEGGTYYINSDLEKIISDVILSRQTANKADTEDSVRIDDRSIVEYLKTENERLNGFIDTKDSQISELYKLLDQQQQLSLNDKREKDELKHELQELKQIQYQVDDDVQAGNDESVSQSKKDTRGFWSRVFNL